MKPSNEKVKIQPPFLAMIFIAPASVLVFATGWL
jgi:hypothetical protein